MLVRRLLTSSEYAWGEIHFDDPEKLGPSEEEPVGDVGLAVAVEVTEPGAIGVDPSDQKPPVIEGLPEDAELPILPSLVPPTYTAKPGGRLVVIGDSFIGSNAGGYTGNNSDLLFNSIAWLIEEEDQLTERANDTADQLLQLSIVQEAFVGLLSIFLVPGLAAFIAVLTMIRRRRL